MILDGRDQPVVAHVDAVAVKALVQPSHVLVDPGRLLCEIFTMGTFESRVFATLVFLVAPQAAILQELPRTLGAWKLFGRGRGRYSHLQAHPG